MGWGCYPGEGERPFSMPGIGAKMNLFEWLLVGHLVGDFLLQSDSMADQKGRQWTWMFRHVGAYMLVLTVVLVGYWLAVPLPVWPLAVAWLFLLATHIILDRRSFTQAWMRLVGMSPDHPWLPIVVDQVFHVLTLAVSAQFLVLVTG
jgi:hypothetical protein